MIYSILKVFDHFLIGKGLIFGPKLGLGKSLSAIAIPIQERIKDKFVTCKKCTILASLYSEQVGLSLKFLMKKPIWDLRPAKATTIHIDYHMTFFVACLVSTGVSKITYEKGMYF